MWLVHIAIDCIPQVTLLSKGLKPFTQLTYTLLSYKEQQRNEITYYTQIDYRASPKTSDCRAVRTTLVENFAKRIFNFRLRLT